MSQYVLGKQPNELGFKYDDVSKKITLIDKNNINLTQIQLDNINKIQQIQKTVNQIVPGIKYTFTVSEQGIQKINITKEELGITGQPQMDVIDGQGYNITADSRLDRRWIDGKYELSMNGGWTIGTYTLKSAQGFRGQKGDDGGSVTSVNGQIGEVNIEFPVTSVNEKTGDVELGISDIKFKQVEATCYPDSQSQVLYFINIQVKSGQICHVVDNFGLAQTEISILYPEGGIKEQAQIWLDLRQSTNVSVSFDYQFGFIGTPSFEGGKCYVISIQEDIIVVGEYTTGE